MSFLFDRLDGRRHGTLARGDQVILAIRVNLIPFQFGVLSGGGQDNRASRGVDLGGQLITLLERIANSSCNMTMT